MQYWANIDGVQYGPVPLEDLPGLGLNAESYVWREGLDEWVQAKNLEELAGLFAVAGEDAAIPAGESVPPPIPEGAEAYAAPPVAASAATGVQVVYVREPQAAVEPCPPTNLVWGILTTFLCFSLFGIISIIYAARVTACYNRGEIDRAKKFSDRAAMWSILAIVLGIVMMSVMIPIELLAASYGW